MAAVASSPLASSEEKTNGAKLSRLLIDGGTTVLRSVFDYHHPPANLAADLNTNFSTLNNLWRRRVLNGHQWDKLFPPGGAAPDSNTFDITLLFLLLTTICGLSPPPTGWHAKPPPSDTSHEANLARIKFFRNVLYGHVTTTGVDTHSFSALWLEISTVLVALGLHQSEIDRLKAERGGEEDYLDALREWAVSDKVIKTQLNDMHQAQTKTQQTVQKSYETLQENTSKLDEVLHIGKNMQQVVTEIHQSQLNTDQEEEILKKLAKVNTQNSIQYYAERYLEGTRESIFAKVTNWLDDRNSPNRVMIIGGNAGMGKSVIAAEMCKRMQESGKLSGSHFCQHDKARHRNPKVMLQSLAYHLSRSLPEYKNALAEQLSRNLGLEINDMEVGDLFELLFEEPLSRLSDPGSTSLVVIDALDESEYQGRNELLDLIAKYFNKLPLWIRFLMTTRPEINICDSLKSLQPLLLEPSDKENLKDIRLFFKQQLRNVLESKNQEVILEELVEMSEGVILCAHFLVDFLKKNVSVLTLEHLESTVPSGISSVYQSYFKRLENELGKELKITEDQFFSFLNAITAAREPLPLGFVSKLLFPCTLSSAVQRKLNNTIACISSLLPVQDGCIHFFHKSVKDWLVDKSCYAQHNYSVDEKEGHHILSGLCIYEFDEVKRKGVGSTEQFSDTTKYALQHGVQHMIESDEDTRSCSLEQLVNMYVLDVELVYAKLCVNSATASEDIINVKNQDGLKGVKSLGTLLFLLRKHRRALKELPRVIFQTLLNEGGPELSTEASNLLENKYSDIPYMEYLDKNDLQGSVQTTFYCSSQVACFDVSPRSDYMVCECSDGTIQLWSLHTGNLMWKRPVVEEKRYPCHRGAFRTIELSSCVLFSQNTVVLSFFRSVTFHPIKAAILPGVLSHAYNFNGDLNRFFPECKCVFSVCSIYGDTILTDSPGDGKCLILWSLKNGTEITRIVRDKVVLSFARSLDGRLLAISHSTGSVCLLDASNGFQTLAETVAPNAYRRMSMITFSADGRFLFCGVISSVMVYISSFFRLSVNVENRDNCSLDVSSDGCSYEPRESESCSKSGFTLGDPLWFALGGASGRGSFAFVVNKQSYLSLRPYGDSLEMLFINKQTKDNDGGNSVVRQLVFSLNGETVYVVDGKTDGTRVTAWDVSSGKLKAENIIGREICIVNCCLAPVTEGVLLTTVNGTLELWDFELPECVRYWTGIANITKMIAVSDERVVCAWRNVGEVIMLDTTSGDRLTIYSPLGSFVACSSKCQLITFESGLLRSVHSVLWKKNWPFRFNVFSGMFSPTEQFIIIVVSESRRLAQAGVYVLDALSGNTLHSYAAGRVFDCKFVSDEECVMHTDDASTGFRLQLFNVRSGHLLSAIDIDKDNCAYCVASCPGKSLIAIGLKHFKFKVIRVNLRNDDTRSSRRSIKLQE